MVPKGFGNKNNDPYMPRPLIIDKPVIINCAEGGNLPDWNEGNNGDFVGKTSVYNPFRTLNDLIDWYGFKN